jgi:hypothetical protein
MSINEVFDILSKTMPQPTKIILDSEERYLCFEITQIPALKNLINRKFPTVTHVHIDILQTEDGNVFNIMFFDTNGEHVSGCELTKNEVFWDDDE